MLTQMRPKLLQPTRRRPHERRQRRRRHAGPGGSLPAGVAAPTPASIAPAPRYDPAVARVREAGGPIDHASYACACGCVFRASVSTTVSCPHCGAGQAW